MNKKHILVYTILKSLNCNCLPETAKVVVPLEDGDVGVSEPGEEGGARERGGAAAQHGELAVVALWAHQARRQHLRHAHHLEHLGGELLQAADVDRALLGRGQVAPAHAQVARRTHHAARQTQRVVREDRTSGAVVILRTRN
jgi:hypothetical protein